VTQPASSVSAGWATRAAVAVARRPALWPTAVVQLFRLAAPGWWRRRPFVPLPDRAYLRFRLETAYGDDRDPEPADVVTYLHWCREWPR
jgi:hypothetical protein